MFSSKIESVNWRLKLNNNFHIWKECIQSILSANQCVGTIMQDYSLGDENHKLLDRKAYSILLQCLNDQDILLVMGSSSISGARVQSKFKELMNLKIEFGHLKDGVMKFSLLINEIEKMIGCKMNEAVKCHHLIAVLPDGLESVVNSFIVMKMTDLKFNDLKEAIMVKEVLVNDKSNVFLTNEDNCVMLTHKKFFGKARKVFHRNQPNQSFRGKVSRKCFSCGSDKHLIRDCKSNHVMIAETDLTNVSRPDIMASVSLLSRFLERPSELLWKSACQVLRYLVSTRFKKLQLGYVSIANFGCTFFYYRPSSISIEAKHLNVHDSITFNSYMDVRNIVQIVTQLIHRHTNIIVNHVRNLPNVWYVIVTIIQK
ncbi:hypothetical protein BLOT_005326 [Blomia tropicalis]|nr:hypothetical protein BLOT_005326 [Blomia tropicalis]